ncbi:MAG: hypothetical protein GEU28_04120 [Dehalococcoidia bacterium]|nr:hypothetical protein [Dehalococcoidia bacterium]
MKLILVFAVAIAAAAIGNVTGTATTADAAVRQPQLVAADDPAPSALNPRVWSRIEIKMLNQHNRVRINRGVPRLRPTDQMGRVANHRCNQIKTNFSHDGWQAAFGKFNVHASTIGENIAWNAHPHHKTTIKAFQQWMNSPGHRANILRPSFKRVGIGHCATPDGRHFWVGVFAG